ncbi:MAG: dihydroorotate dehydrogenase electron transfer subunit [Pseudomonadota bacterium]|nr:dihydroorotate dehydrogenase electron transfer subunit [Pseudomonadota bacterium]
MASDRRSRGTIHLETAEVVAHTHHEGDQHTLVLHAPNCAQKAQPGMFAHLQCDPATAMRRPLSIMRVSPDQGWVEFLYKSVGHGTRQLSQRRPGETLSLLGPIGTPFSMERSRPRPLLLGGGVGIPPMVFLADHFRRDREQWTPLAIFGSEVPFPFTLRPSRILLPEMPSDVIAAMPMLEDWGVPSRLTSTQGYQGCHNGYVTDLARYWLHALDSDQRREVEVYACGPTPMLAAVAALAREFVLPCQVALEEFMACAVGGCAGCVVEIQTPSGPAMKRVCVDGPVFDAHAVFPSTAK